MSSGVPTFSVVVPTRNRSHLLGRAVGSVLDQTCPDLELLVIDDASDDATPGLLEALEDPRVQVVRRAVPGGAAAARNDGIASARGEFIAFLDDDDAYRPGFLARMHQHLDAAPPSVGFAWCGVRRIRETEHGERVESSGTWRPEFASRQEAYLGFLRSRGIGTNCGLVVRRSCFAEVGLFDARLAKAEDTDLLIRLARSFDFLAVPEILVEVHLHPGPRLTAYDREMAAAYELILSKHRDTLEAHPEVAAALEYKTGWLHYHGGERRAGRRHLLRSLRKAPLWLRPWAALLLLELAGGRGAGLHGALSRLSKALRTP